MKKVLFICKQGEDYRIEAYGYFRRFSGLFNSARMVNEMLQKNGIDSSIVVARDNNDIDRLVTAAKPDICVIEAYWVVPEKFEILHKLHPRITWLIRVHSEVPFWAQEGMSMDWTLRYLDYHNVILAPNAERLFHDMKVALSVKYSQEEIGHRVVYLPNYYPSNDKGLRRIPSTAGTINIGCFGAIRPLKNQLIQALAAVEYANRNKLNLIFHINGNRIEGGGDPILRNIRDLFRHSIDYELVEHPWQPHKNFLDVVAQMDLGLQVSFSESFNIVAADMVTCGVPVVTSSEVGWVSKIFQADPNNMKDIVSKMERAVFFGKVGTAYNRYLLTDFSNTAKVKWLAYVS